MALPYAAASGLLVLAVLWSGLNAPDRLAWLSEAVPVLIVLPLLAVTRRRYPLTPILYALIVAECLIILVGARYTYAHVPLGLAIARWLSLARNPWDRIAHLAQGFVPAIAAREILIRGRYVRTRPMLAWLVLAVVLAVSAAWELLEWAGATLAGKSPDQALGTQGDPWDTQWDMLCALIGGLAALLAVSRRHDRQIGELERHLSDDATLGPDRQEPGVPVDRRPGRTKLTPRR